MGVEVRRLSDVIGAEVSGVDLSKPLSREAFTQNRKIRLDHNIILFRGQDLTPEQQIVFSPHFGKIELRTPGAGRRGRFLFDECLGCADVRTDGAC